jgi:hypothetical protein
MRPAQLPRCIKLCRRHDSFYLTIPIEYVRAHQFDAGDTRVLWQPDASGAVKLEFVPVQSLEAPYDNTIPRP